MTFEGEQRSTSRRAFVMAGATGVAAVGQSASSAENQAAKTKRPRRAGRRREVWVASICQDGLTANSLPQMCDKMLNRMAETLPMQPDVICLPECFHVANLSGKRPPIEQSSEAPLGEFSKPFAKFAAEHQTNLICPIHTKVDGHYYNAAVVIDRAGKYVGQYQKINPTDSEIAAGIVPGPLDPPVFDLDFGRIGIQICFDINWHDNWKRLSAKGAELVFWPSAFAGGQMLNWLAAINKYFVVSSTRIQASKFVDLLGDDMVASGRFGKWICSPINLETQIVQGWQDIRKLEAAREKYGRQIDVRIKHVEAVAAVESLGEVPVRDVLREFSIQTSVEMLNANAKLQNEHRPG